VKFSQLMVGFCKALFLQMKPNLVTYLKRVGNLVLIMVLLVLRIGFIQNIMDLLAYVMNKFNEFVGIVGLRLTLGRFFPSGCKGKCYINGA